MKKLLLMLVSTMILLYSCTNEDPLLDTHQTKAINEKRSTEDAKSYSFLYKGKTYTSIYEKVDSLVVFKDSEVAMIWEKLKENSSLSTCIHEDGTIEYCDTEADAKERMAKYRQTRAVLAGSIIYNWYILQEVTLQYWTGYHDDRRWDHTFNDNLGWSLSVDSYTGTGMNDRISSCDLKSSYRILQNNTPQIRFTGAKVTFYSDIDFRGFSLILLVNHTRPEIIENDLSYHWMPNGQNWNDVISSMKFETYEFQ